LKNNSFSPYESLKTVRNDLERDNKIPTEPDIMLIVPKKVLICIEAKLGSPNRPTEEKEKNEKITQYCSNNKIVNGSKDIFDFSNSQAVFYEQLFRNLVFAASMAKLDGIEEWYVASLRSQYLVEDKPESQMVLPNVKKILKPKYQDRFIQLMWEELYEICVKNNERLYNLSWYLKNKSFKCGRAFNIS
jgi:hypothetical protein